MFGITVDEYKGRVQRIREVMRENDFAALILFSDSIRVSNVQYVVDFKPIDGYTDISRAIVVLPIDGDPTLYVSFMNYLWGQEVAWFPVKPFSELVADLVKLRDKIMKGKVGLTGLVCMPVDLFEAIKGAFSLSSIQIAPAEPLLGKIKAKKSPAEINLLRKAGELTAIGLEAIKTAVTGGGGKTEREIAAYCAMELFRADGDGPSFDIQIQSGIHSSYNNIRSTEKIVVPGDSILIEMGANYRGYVTDIARGATWGKVDPQQIEIIKVAAEAQRAGIEAVRPGLSAGELNSIIEKVLKDAGYAEFSAEASGYGTGHGIGTDIEEEEPWIKPGSTFLLEEDNVMALKASIFIPGLAGVRVEDNILVTGKGAEIMTPYPRVLTW